MEVERERLFGADLLLRDGAGGVDLALGDPANASGDLALADGNDNIAQALLMRLRVRKGELAPLGWPDYGSRLGELIGEPDLPRTQLKAQVFAREAVEADPRVEEVIAVEPARVEGERAVLRLAMSVLLIDAPTPLNLVFDLDLEDGT
jgi:phage baseplate assembly protein W